MTDPTPPPAPRHVVVAGASRGVGYEVALLLRRRGIAVTALLRCDAARPDAERLGAAVVMADARDADAVAAAMDAAAPFDAVVSTIGGASLDGTRADYLGNRNLIDRCVSAAPDGVHFVLVSSIGAGTSAGAIPASVRERLAAALDEKERAEEHLIRSGLTYTIIRPGGLRSEPATGRGVLTRDPEISGSIHRADVAQLVCDCLLNPGAVDTVFSAVDLDRVRDGLTVVPVSLA